MKNKLNESHINVAYYLKMWALYSNDSIITYVQKNIFSNLTSNRIMSQIIKLDLLEDDPSKAILLIDKNENKFTKNEEYQFLRAYLLARIGKNSEATSLLSKLGESKYRIFSKCLKTMESPFTFTNKMSSITSTDGVHPHFGYLETLIRQYKLKKGAEVGVFMGFHSEHLLQACRNIELYLVDPYGVMKGSGYDDWNNIKFQILYLRLRYRFSKYKRAHFIRNISEEAVKEFKKGELDFVYLDADHRYEGIKKDLSIWTPIVRKGGIIAGHDYKSKQWPGVTKAVNEWAKANNFVIKSGLGMFWYTINK